MTSIQKFKNNLGIFAERLDEIGAEVFRDVGTGFEGEESVAEPSSPSESRSLGILHATGDVTEVAGMNWLPTEILHLIFLHLNARLEDLSCVSLVSRYVPLVVPIFAHVVI